MNLVQFSLSNKQSFSKQSVDLQKAHKEIRKFSS